MVTRRTARLRTGLALLDIVVGTVLLGIALVTILTLLRRSTEAQAAGEQLQTAASLIDEQLNLVLARGPDNYATRFPAEGICDAPFEAFRYRLTFSGGTSGEPYLVTATVSWDGTAGERSASVQALIAPRLGEDTDPDRRPVQPVQRTVAQ